MSFFTHKRYIVLNPCELSFIHIYTDIKNLRYWRLNELRDLQWKTNWQVVTISTDLQYRVWTNLQIWRTLLSYLRSRFFLCQVLRRVSLKSDSWHISPTTFHTMSSPTKLPYMISVDMNKNVHITYTDLKNIIKPYSSEILDHIFFLSCLTDLISATLPSRLAAQAINYVCTK